VHGVLTAEKAASQVPAANIALTLAMYLTLYAALLVAYVSVVFHLARKSRAVIAAPLQTVETPSATTRLETGHA
jgi:cytochrome bd ubiquinol oxidase subunit I